jgi:hypothetical protein
MSLTWEPKPEEVNRAISALEMDYETQRREKRLAKSQRVNWLAWLAWLAAGLIIGAWARLLWLAGRAFFQFLSSIH